MKNILEKEYIKINDYNEKQLNAREFALTVCDSMDSIIKELPEGFYNTKDVSEELLSIFNKSLNYMDASSENPEDVVFGQIARILSCILPVTIAGPEDVFCLRENLYQVKELAESITLQNQEICYQKIVN